MIALWAPKHTSGCFFGILTLRAVISIIPAAHPDCGEWKEGLAMTVMSQENGEL